MKVIMVYGFLRPLCGKRHEFEVSTPAEAVRALAANFPVLKSKLNEYVQSGGEFRIIVDNKPINNEECLVAPAGGSIKIIPVVAGSKRSGILGVVLGGALIASSFFLPTGALLPFLGSLSPSLSSIAFGIGSSMLLGGASQLLSPQPKAMPPQETYENTPSYSFNGAVNTVQQGQPVPVAYGRLIVGSCVISAGITADEYVTGAI
jgi:predicted phage tail protein